MAEKTMIASNIAIRTLAIVKAELLFGVKPAPQWLLHYVVKAPYHCGDIL